MRSNLIACRLKVSFSEYTLFVPRFLINFYAGRNVGQTCAKDETTILWNYVSAGEMYRYIFYLYRWEILNLYRSDMCPISCEQRGAQSDEFDI